ncbi:putative uncharacterized protein [Parachlamydia acanthamoebae UV-7]|uniref:Uncharacterized protein n=3 Tax=Parachlamydia acanthamoebae TaxID=83552 RepID=F8KVN7_PARAV|nr:hypothetical protein [Parachlamydia acanthamoebae]KIA76376.1 hypothetical protein DB43_AK00360 [Parachlamydia acanthamoebae]CCB85173.1 putative uncharacterized protein [Parachlamydia acanthamoebae UV-7]
MDRNEEIFLVTFSDFWAAIKKAKKKLLYGALVFACLAFCYAITRPVEFAVEASFKEKGAKDSGLGSNVFSSLLSGGEAGKSEALVVMKSNRLLQDVIREHGIQADLRQEGWTFPLFKRMKNNLRTEYAYLRNRLAPAVKDTQENLVVTKLQYEGEIPLVLTLKFLTNHTYEITESRFGLLGEGTLGEPFANEAFQVILDGGAVEPLMGQEYTLTIRAIRNVVKDLFSRLNIEPDTQNRSILKLKYLCPNRQEGCKHLNTVMAFYQDLLKKEHQRVSQEQINYLEKRRGTMQSGLHDMMQVFADRVSSDVVNTGFTNTEEGMRFLAEALQKHKQKLLDINLEIERLERAQNGNIVFLDRYGSSDPQVINAILSEIRNLKQECDGLNLVVRRNSSYQDQEQRGLFLKQIQEHELAQKRVDEAKWILARLEENNIQEIKIQQLDSPDYFVSLWNSKLQEAFQRFESCSLEESASREKEYNSCKDNYMAYLNQLTHYFEVLENTLHERISRQQLPQKQFQGISLSTANSLYVQISTEMSQAETLLKQRDFIIAQLEDETFEISSLSSVLTDSVSRQMIDRASTLALSLQDQANRSAKEQTRLREELDLQKQFLKAHLNQTQQLTRLQIELLTSKILALQNVILELSQQKISVLETNLGDFIQSRLDNLHEENDAVQQQLKDLQGQLKQLPSRWIAEKLVNLQMASNQAMVEELTRLVETKNTASNLEIIQSAPLDLAEPPLHPRPPRLLLMTFLGAFLGVFLVAGQVVVETILRGIQASEENLTASGFEVLGRLSPTFQDRGNHPLNEQDLSTLRKAAAFIHPDKELLDKEKVTLFIEGNGAEYCRSLASLLAKTGFKILILPLTQMPESLTSDAGLIPYLETGKKAPTIVKCPFFDAIPAGASSRYEAELLTSLRFNQYLEPLLLDYDWIFVVSHASAKSGDARMLLGHYQRAIISVTNETIDDLRDCCAFISEKDPSIQRAFIFS